MKLKRILAIAAAALSLLGGFFLPNAVAGITDSNRLDNLVMIDSKTISFESLPEMGIPERLGLVANKGAEIMTLYSGNAMDEETAGRAAIRELSRLLGDGPFMMDFGSCLLEDSSVTFIIDKENPNINMIVWEMTLVDEHESRAVVTIDDETGIIMKIIFRQERQPDTETDDDVDGLPPTGPSDAELNANAQSLTMLMREYYDLPVILGGYDFSSSQAYYRADFSYAGRVVSMYGVVRPTGFTMNERVTPKK